MSKLSPGTLLLGIVAILFGLLGAYVVRLQLQPAPVAEAASENPRALVVPLASTNLKAGRKISLGDVSIYRLTPEQIKRAGIDLNFMANPSQIIGRILSEDLPKGTTFQTSALYPEGVIPNPADRLLPGFRAVTVMVEGPAAVAGFTTPGAWVDVLFRANEDEQQDLPELTVTLVESVEVLALDEQTFTGAKVEKNTDSGTKKMAVTLAVRPEQAAALRVVDGRGSLSLVLRNPNDDTPTALNLPRTMHDVLDRPYTKWRMQVYRGGALSSVDFRREQRLSPSAEEIATKVAASGNKPVDPPPADK